MDVKAFQLKEQKLSVLLTSLINDAPERPMKKCKQMIDVKKQKNENCTVHKQEK